MLRGLSKCHRAAFFKLCRIGFTGGFVQRSCGVSEVPARISHRSCLLSMKRDSRCFFRALGGCSGIGGLPEAFLNPLHF